MYKLSGNDIEQTANTYDQNTCKEALIKCAKAKLRQLKLALLKHLLISIIINRLNFFETLKILQ